MQNLFILRQLLYSLFSRDREIWGTQSAPYEYEWTLSKLTRLQKFVDSVFAFRYSELVVHCSLKHCSASRLLQILISAEKTLQVCSGIPTGREEYYVVQCVTWPPL